MRIYNRYIFSLSLLLLLTTVLLSIRPETPLDVYFSLYLIETLVLTTLFVFLEPKARRGLEVVAYILFLGFLVIVGMKVLGILFGL